ncbi:MAG: hypothetical protein ABIG61_07295 [Planctomycetota bacterium]
MAVGVLVLNSGNARPVKLGRGLVMATGRIGFSANSSFVASTIEKQFRARCERIDVSVPSGYVINYKRSATFKRGMLYAFAPSTLKMSSVGYALSGTTVIGLKNVPLPICSGTFTAYGF